MPPAWKITVLPQTTSALAFLPNHPSVVLSRRTYDRKNLIPVIVGGLIGLAFCAWLLYYLVVLVRDRTDIRTGGSVMTVEKSIEDTASVARLRPAVSDYAAPERVRDGQDYQPGEPDVGHQYDANLAVMPTPLHEYSYHGGRPGVGTVLGMPDPSHDEVRAQQQRTLEKIENERRDAQEAVAVVQEDVEQEDMVQTVQALKAQVSHLRRQVEVLQATAEEEHQAEHSSRGPPSYTGEGDPFQD
jgi:hypothetical protein